MCASEWGSESITEDHLTFDCFIASVDDDVALVASVGDEEGARHGVRGATLLLCPRLSVYAT